MAWNRSDPIGSGEPRSGTLWERALHGLYPDSFYNLRVLAHDGWYPSWGLSWTRRTSSRGIWRKNDVASHTWAEV